MINPLIKRSVKLLPNKPGVYLMIDENDVIIYIGKAKRLDKRVSQYFYARKAGKSRLWCLMLAVLKQLLPQMKKKR